MKKTQFPSCWTRSMLVYLLNSRNKRTFYNLSKDMKCLGYFLFDTVSDFLFNRRKWFSSW